MHPAYNFTHGQERAREEGEERADTAKVDAMDTDGGDGSGGEEDGLRSEVLRGKGMDVGSMDALKKRIEVRVVMHAESTVCFGRGTCERDYGTTRCVQIRGPEGSSSGSHHDYRSDRYEWPWVMGFGDSRTDQIGVT